jgi:hypothetical protein
VVVVPAALVLPVVEAEAVVPSALPAAVVVRSLAAVAVPVVLVRPVVGRAAAAPLAAPAVSARSPVVAALSVLRAAVARSPVATEPSALPADAAHSPRVAVLSAHLQAAAPSRRRVVASHFSSPTIFPSPDRATACLFVLPAIAVRAPQMKVY